MNTNFPNFTTYDPLRGQIADAPVLERRLTDLRGYFADERAYAAALARENALLYTVSNVEPAQGEGALHYGITCLLPGRVGDEYYLTKGHYHAWRPAAEYYMGLNGEGILLLEDETGHSWTLPLTPNSGVYVPGNTAHRTMNVGTTPLTFLGIYPANAGHDYATIVDRNFRQVVVAVAGKPVVMERSEYVRSLRQ